MMNDSWWLQQAWVIESNGLKWRVVVQQEINCMPGYALDPNSKSGACKECVPPTTSDAGSKECDLCIDAFDLSHDRICKPCPRHATCAHQSVMVHPGYYRSSAPDLALFACPTGAEACRGGNTTENQCSPGYTGVLCAVCQAGYVAQFTHCQDCASTKIALISATATVTAFIIAMLVLYKVVLQNKRLAAMMESVSLLVALKIYFAAMQILGEYATLLSGVLFSPMQQFLNSLSTIGQIAHFWDGLGFSCAHPGLGTHKARLLASTLTPIGLIVCIGGVYLFRVRVLRHEHGKTLRTHCFCVLLILYVTLPSTSAMIFKTFSRDRRSLGETGDYLVADYSVSTNSIEYQQFLAPFAFVLMALYPIGINLLYVLLLWMGRAEMKSCAEKEAQSAKDGGLVSCGSMITFLHQPYSNDCFWWEAVDSARMKMSRVYAVCQ